MVREALRGAEEQGATVREVFLADKKMEFCKGCQKCLNTGECCIDDDFNELRSMLYKADGLIIGSPTYGAYVSAIMKNLIDRLGLYEVATSSLGGKYIVGISAANSAPKAKKVANFIANFGNAGTFLRSYASGSLGAGFRGGRKAGEEKDMLDKARQLGKKLVMDICTGRKYVFQSIPGRILSSLVMKPAFTRYILNNKEGEAKVLYESLKSRNLIA